jgi:O-antigen/teichoic acid export membrane protein
VVRVRSVRVLRNVVTNYLRFFVSGLIGFLITPTMVHLLGDGRYGLWVTVFSLTGYFGLVDQGIRPSLVRYVSRDRAAGDDDSLSRTLNSALALYTIAGVVTMVATFVAASQFGAWFPRIDAALLPDARATVLLAGAALALGFPFGVFGAALSGLQRYDVANGLGIGVAVLRALLFVLVLRLGGGLVALAWVSLGTSLLGHVLTWLAVRRLLPKVAWAPRFVEGRALRRVGSYSGIAFVGAIASSLAFQTDSLVITGFLGAALVTPFALGAGLVENVRSLVHSATWVLSPTASEMETLGETDSLHAMLIVGAKYSVLLSWPVLFALLVFGEGLMRTWVGPAYASTAPLLAVLSPGGPPASAAQILTLLAAPTLLSLPQSAASSLLFGVSRHKGVVALSLINALLNLGLSLWWVRSMGLAGVALGTAVPLALVGGVATAVYASRALGIGLGRYLWEGMGRPGLVTLTFLVPALTVQALARPAGWGPLALAVGGSWILFAAMAWAVAFAPGERAHWGRTWSGLMGRAPAPAAASEATR